MTDTSFPVTSLLVTGRSPGRFDETFIETRRAALEKSLNKIANHPVLGLDPDLKLFLESDSFAVDVSA